MITSIGMILPSDYIGTGLGIYKASNNIGTSILEIIVGIVQDHTVGERYNSKYIYIWLLSIRLCIDSLYQRIDVMLVFIVLAGVGFLLILLLLFTQHKYLKGLLEVGRKKREERMQELNNNELMLTKQGLDSLHNTRTTYFNYFYVAVFVFFFICAWVLFFVFAATGNIAI